MPELTITQALAVALQQHQAGRLQEAEQIYRKILAKQPANADALHGLGVVAYQTQRMDLAADLLRNAVAVNPNHFGAYNSLGNALVDLGQLDDAVVAFRHALALRPNYADAFNNLGNALHGKGQLDDAVAAYRQAIALKPNFPEAHNNLGGSLHAQGLLEESIASYRQSVALRPNFATAHNNLGNALKDSGQLDEAIAACRQALALNPKFPAAHNNLANALVAEGLFSEAIAAYRQALLLNPNLPEVHGNLIRIMNYLPEFDAKAIGEELGRFNRLHAEPLRKFIPAHANDRNPDRRLRIGYVSPDFRNHVVGWNILPLFEHRDRESFEYTCYANVRRPDETTRRFEQSADHWRPIVGLSDEQVARQIVEDKIDILVDLALHTSSSRVLVFARKPAPIQVTFCGYPGSTGLSTIDYRFSDPYLDPIDSDESIYTEKTIRLPDSVWCYDPMEARDIPVNPLPALENGFITFGSLNNFCKVNDTILATWAQVLQRVQNSRLILLAPLGAHRQRTLDRLAQEGINPSRIEFISRQSPRAYMQQYHRIDVGMDTFPWNGHTTSLDSFWMGVPVVSFIGPTAVGRAGWCQLCNLELSELAGKTAKQFVQLAVQLATDLPRLQQLRATLRQRMEQSPLMDAPRFARNVEAAYRKIWQTWCEKISATNS
jgi:predicted O-linked N-acetylglucosamine transferase (SPINDLY family)